MLVFRCYSIPENSKHNDKRGKFKVPPKRDLLKGSSDSLLLCLIEQKPMYGYQIIKVLEARSQGYFKFKEGTLYPALHRLEKTGLVNGMWQVLSNGRRRRYYHITDKGRSALVMERSQWQEFLHAVNRILQPVNIKS